VLGWHVPLVSLASHRDIVTRLRAATTATLIADCPNRHEVRDPVDDMAPTIAALDAFLPSSSDFEIIAADADPVQLARTLAQAGGGTVVLKRGEAGALVIAPDVGEYVVPAVPVQTVDPTGAGDAFCGAFLVAFAATGDPVTAAMHGSVAGSFAAETADPTALRSLSAAERDGRMHYVKQRIVRV
jgi:ribokinase